MDYYPPARGDGHAHQAVPKDTNGDESDEEKIWLKILTIIPQFEKNK